MCKECSHDINSVSWVKQKYGPHAFHPYPSIALMPCYIQECSWMRWPQLKRISIFQATFLSYSFYAHFKLFALDSLNVFFHLFHHICLSLNTNRVCYCSKDALKIELQPWEHQLITSNSMNDTSYSMNDTS